MSAWLFKHYVIIVGLFRCFHAKQVSQPVEVSVLVASDRGIVWGNLLPGEQVAVCILWPHECAVLS
jgi:hypothetical protein